MSTLTEIRAALGPLLDTIPRLVVSKNLAAVQTLGDGGGCVIGGPTGDYTGAMGRGLMTWVLPIYVLAPTVDYDQATEILDELTAPYGDRSIPELLWNHGREAAGGLGILDANGQPNVDAHIDALTAYGVEFENAGIAHIGAVLSCVVYTPGKPT